MHVKSLDQTVQKQFFGALFVAIVVVGVAVASCLVYFSPDRAVWVRALAGDIVSCSWARHFTLNVTRLPLSTKVYNFQRLHLKCMSSLI